MTNWQTKKLGELSKVQTGPFGAQLHEKDYVKTGGTPIITVENLSRGTVKLLPSTPRVSDDDKNRLHRYVLREGDIVFSRVGSVDRSAYVTRNADGWMFSGRLLRVHPSEKLDSKYLNYHLNDEKTKNLIRNLAVGGTMPSLNTEILNFVPIKFPEKLEQERIVSVLEVWDKYIEKLEQKIALKEQLKKGMMQQLLTGKRRLPSFTNPWITVKLSELGTARTSSIDKLFAKDEQSVGLLNYMDVYKRDHICATDIFQVVTAKDSQITTSNLKKGDILFTPSSETPTDIGHSAVVTEDLPGTVYSYHLMRLRPKNSTISHRYSAYCFKTYAFYKELWKRAQGATRFTLSKDALESARITVTTDIKEQEAIATLFENIDSQVANYRQELNTFQLQKKYLLKNLITGTIRTPEDLKPLAQTGVQS